jgi:hypothetical protein
MLPLERRNNRLLSIHIRIVSQNYARYILQILTAEGKSYTTELSENTMVKFKN